MRRCSIHLLQSLLALPLHFANMPIKVSCDWWRAGHVTWILISDWPVKELVPGTDRNQPLTNFNHLRPRIVNLLVNALQVETEAQNAHMLIGSLMFVVQVSCDWRIRGHVTSILISDWSRTPPRWRTRRCVRVTATRRPPPVTRDTCSLLVGELTSCI